MSRPRRQKKNFRGCGHRGFSKKYCHLCKQKEEGYDFRRDTMSREEYQDILKIERGE